jgi:predicted dehydrogenase
MKPYRAAIIGTGDTAGAHIKALRHAGERVEVVGAMDINEVNVRAFCEKHAIPRAFTDAHELLAATKPDLVHIVTPPGSHCELAIASLEAGAWVYCEKPLCVSLAEFDRMAAAEQRTGRYVNTVFQWRSGSAAQHLKRLIASGEMGRLLVGVCNVLWYRGLAYYQLPWRGQWAAETGGVASTMGIHLLDLFLWLVSDEWQDVRAVVATLDRPIETEDAAAAIVRFTNNAIGSIAISSVSPRQESYLRLDFQRTTVDVTGVYGYSNANWRYALPDGSADSEALERWRTVQDDIASSHVVQFMDMLDSIDQNERPAISGSEARRIIEFLACLYKSALTGETVARGSVTPDDPFYYAMNGVRRAAR